LRVTAVIAIVSRARAHILRLTSARLHDLVVSDWAARAVLRYRRLRGLWKARLSQLGKRPAELGVDRLRLPMAFAGHALVLTLGFLLVVPMMAGEAPARQALNVYSGSLHAASGLHLRTAPEMREVNKESSIEERQVTLPPPPPPPAAPRSVPPATFTPPPGSGGDGLAAIYAVFGNSPGLSWALRVANCESHYNPLAVNRYSGASGLFQFMPSTWNANFPGWNIWDPYAQARAALVFYNAGRQSAWTCK
jgi:Transglycosylase SLT domain